MHVCVWAQVGMYLCVHGLHVQCVHSAHLYVFAYIDVCTYVRGYTVHVCYIPYTL